jgi:predicted component of type VI protein secretion system
MSTVAVRLIIEDLEGSTTVVNLGTEDVTIGRKPHNTIQLTEQNVSRSHAKLSFRDDGWLIQDLGSYNGVKVNGVPIATPTLLRESDLIQIGDYHLTLTDDVDRATVDIERPRYAANDPYAAGAHAGMMSSSAELPSVSVEDLHAPARHQQHAQIGYAAPVRQEEEKQSKAGLIIGIIGAAAAVIALVAFFAMPSGEGKDDGGKDVDQAAANKGDTPAPEPTPDAPPPTTTGPEPVPEVPSTTAAAPSDDGGEVVPETTAGGEDVPVVEPTPQPTPVEKPQPKPSKPKLPPDQALAEARKASLSGDNKKAYSLAKDAYDQNQSGDALNLMGVAACKMGNETKAKAAHKKMTAKDKAMLEKLCGSLGIEL